MTDVRRQSSDAATKRCALEPQLRHGALFQLQISSQALTTLSFRAPFQQSVTLTMQMGFDELEFIKPRVPMRIYPALI